MKDIILLILEFKLKSVDLNKLDYTDKDGGEF